MGFVAAFDRVLFYNEASRFAVLRMKTADMMVPEDARSPYRYHDHLIRFNIGPRPPPGADRHRLNRRSPP